LLCYKTLKKKLKTMKIKMEMDIRMETEMEMEMKMPHACGIIESDMAAMLPHCDAVTLRR